uniref:Uncharacterized protein n=1 Tax=Mola mola TaxID=94237 RepID=A0A3Q3WE05_MOLML
AQGGERLTCPYLKAHHLLFLLDRVIVVYSVIHSMPAGPGQSLHPPPHHGPARLISRCLSALPHGMLRTRGLARHVRLRSLQDHGKISTPRSCRSTLPWRLSTSTLWQKEREKGDPGEEKSCPGLWIT